MAKKKTTKKPAKKAKRAVRKTVKKAARKTAPAVRVRPSSRLLDIAPDKLPVTERRALRLARVAGVEAKKLAGKTVAEVNKLLEWKVSPELLLFRRVCGQVLQKDPVTGAENPVPNATVHVEDTDCNFISYAPPDLPWIWLCPILCTREEIAAVRTDDCGRFCVYLPYWDIDWIVRWYRGRLCWWDFRRIKIRDLYELYEPPRIREPRPEPDPWPILSEGFERIRDFVGEATAQRLEVARHLSLQGEAGADLEAVLEEPAFIERVPPPLPRKMAVRGLERDAMAAEALEVEPQELGAFEASRFIGPFLRCIDIKIGIWERVFDVPDITFRVTQDYDGDGVEEEIYSEGFFDVRWDSGSIPDVKLYASGNALAVTHCGPIKEIRCRNKASIEAAGYLDLEPAYHDDTSGYGLRVNRRTATGLYPPPPVTGAASPLDPANAPYAGNVNLHGCIRLKNATHYRLRWRYRASPGDPWGTMLPFKGITWNAARKGAGPMVPFVPNSDGWYPIQPAGILVHPDWVLPWQTAAKPPGTWQIDLQLGRQVGVNINVVDTSAKRTFETDNVRPTASLTEVRWRRAVLPHTAPWDNTNSEVVIPTTLLKPCPVINRPVGQDIHLRVVWSATAKHLRNASLHQWGCGGGGMTALDLGPGRSPRVHRTRTTATGTRVRPTTTSARRTTTCYRAPGRPAATRWGSTPTAAPSTRRTGTRPPPRTGG